MKRLTHWLDSQHPPAGFVRKCFDGPPFGNCYITIDPDRQARFASGNMNCVYLCGAEPGMNSDSIRHIIDLFAAEGIERFFVWLSPGPRNGGYARLAWRKRTYARAMDRLSDAMSQWRRPFRSAPTWRCTKSARTKSPQCANLGSDHLARLCADGRQRRLLRLHGVRRQASGGDCSAVHFRRHWLGWRRPPPKDRPRRARQALIATG